MYPAPVEFSRRIAVVSPIALSLCVWMFTCVGALRNNCGVSDSCHSTTRRVLGLSPSPPPPPRSPRASTGSLCASIRETRMFAKISR